VTRSQTVRLMTNTLPAANDNTRLYIGALWRPLVLTERANKMRDSVCSVRAVHNGAIAIGLAYNIACKSA